MIDKYRRTTNMRWHMVLITGYSIVYYMERNSWNLNMWAVPCENMASCINGQWRPRSACASAQSDQGLPCSVTESLYTREYINGEQRPGWYFAHAPDDLYLRIFRKFEGMFFFFCFVFFFARDVDHTISQSKYITSKRVFYMYAYMSMEPDHTHLTLK